jgi:hypothetical protein
MLKNVISLFVITTVLCSCAATRPSVKTTDAKTTPKEETVIMEEAEVVEDVAIMAVEEEAPVAAVLNPFSFEPVKSIQYNPKFGIANSINDRYDFYWEKNSSNRYNAYGIVDKDGNVILPHLFTRGSGPNNNYEVVLAISGTSYGLFNLEEQRWTIPMMYQELSSLGNNVFVAKKDNRWGLVDNNNAMIGPFLWKQTDRLYHLENYLMVSIDDAWGIYSIVEKKLTIPAEYTSVRKLDRENYFVVRKGTKVNVVDINNKPLFKNWYDEVRSSSMNTDYFIVKENSRYGVVDHNEKVIVPITYLEFSESNYSDGSYLARNKDGKYGFMLIDGRITLPFNYDNVRKGYYNNIVSIRNGKCGLVSVNSGMPTEIVTCEFDNITEGTKSFIVEKNGKFGLLTQYGKPLTDIEYTSLESLKDSYSDELVIYLAKKGNSVFLVNEQGKVINESEFLEVSPLYRKNPTSYYSQRFLYLKFKAKSGKYGIVDKLGKVIIQPQFDDVVSEDENLLVVRSKDKCGLYSMIAQKMIVNFEYDLIIKSNNNYVGFLGKEIDFISIKSLQVSKISTTNKEKK